MKLFKTYLKLEYKKALQSFPTILLGTFALFCVTVLLLFSWQTQKKEHATSPAVIGVATEKDEPYMDFFMGLLKNMDNLKNNYTFTLIEKEQVSALLEKKKIDIAFLIPKNYISSLIDGTDEPIVLRFSGSDPSITTLMMRQLSEAVSSIMLETEAAIYTMNDYYAIHRLPNQSKDERNLNIKYINRLLTRHSIFSIETLEAEQGLSYTEYYFTVGLLLLLLSWGLLSPSCFRPEKKLLQLKLAQSGLSIPLQFLAKQLACCGNLCLLFLMLSLILSLVAPLLPITILQQTTFVEWMRAFLPVLLAIPLIAAFFHVIYELIPDLVAGILFLFISILLMGYLSGYFYPFSMLPNSIQNLSHLLPTRILFQYTSGCLTKSFSLVALGKLLLTTFILELIALCTRMYRLEVTR